MKGFYKLMPLAIAALVCSCAKDGVVSTTATEETKTKNSEVFAYVGTKAPTTYLEGIKPDMTDWPKNYAKPSAITNEEMQQVLDYITNNPEKNIENPLVGIDTFAVQNLGYVAQYYNPTETSSEKGQIHNRMDGLFLYTDDGWYKPRDFNGNNNPNHSTAGTVLIPSAFANNVSCNASALSDSNEKPFKFYKVTYTVNGEEHTDIYLAIDYCGAKDNGAAAVEANGVYDDWVIKITPYGTPKQDTPENPDPTPDPDPADPDPETPEVTPTEGEVEFDVHLQEHTDWYEIKTTVHLRDTVNVRIFIPIPEEYQAQVDDFDIRTGGDYDHYVYVTNDDVTIENFDVTFKCGADYYTTNIQIKHQKGGIEILIEGNNDQMKEALKRARECYDDGVTFEIHSYVKYYDDDGNLAITPEQIWEYLEQVECAQTDTGSVEAGDHVTYTYGQTTTAYSETKRVDYKAVEEDGQYVVYESYDGKETWTKVE